MGHSHLGLGIYPLSQFQGTMETIIFFPLLNVCLCLADSISCENFVFYLAKKGRSSKLGNQAYNWRLKGISGYYIYWGKVSSNWNYRNFNENVAVRYFKRFFQIKKMPVCDLNCTWRHKGYGHYKRVRTLQGGMDTTRAYGHYKGVETLQGCTDTTFWLLCPFFMTIKN